MASLKHTNTVDLSDKLYVKKWNREERDRIKFYYTNNLTLNDSNL